MAEVAGLVMAAFPIIIEGLHLYVEGVESIKKWWSYVKTLKRLIRKLEMEKTKLENSCTELLYDIVDEQTLSLLLEKPGGYRWREDSLQQALRVRLDKSFSVYMGAIQDMKETMDEFKDKLELDADNKPRWTDYRAHKREWKRVHFCFCEHTIEELLDNLGKDNKDLADLLGHSQRMERIRLSKSTGNAKVYDRVRDHARNLYRTLKHTFSWPCGCAIPHNASLKLEYRSNPEPAVTGANSGTQFNVLFFFETGQNTAQGSRIWRDTLIEPLSSPEHQEQIPSSKIAAAKSFASSAATRNNASAIVAATGISFTAIGGQGATSTFNVQPLPQLPAQNKASLAPQASPSATMSPRNDATLALRSLSSSEKIEYLCGAMLKTTRIECLGILADDCDKQHRISITRTSNGPDPLEKLSLEALLAEKTLEKKDRLMIGVKLASALLQLHSTPWLCEYWTTHDIYFFKQARTALLALDKPFVSRCFDSPNCTNQASPKNNRFLPSEIRNQSLFALGIVLIELWYGKPLEGLRVDADMGCYRQANSITDFATATRLIEAVYADAGDWYGDAVRRCIRFDFDQRYTTLDRESLKEAVHMGVIKPLENNLGTFCGANIKEILV